jgi:hypothetical protein
VAQAVVVAVLMSPPDRTTTEAAQACSEKVPAAVRPIQPVYPEVVAQVSHTEQAAGHSTQVVVEQ